MSWTQHTPSRAASASRVFMGAPVFILAFQQRIQNTLTSVSTSNLQLTSYKKPWRGKMVQNVIVTPIILFVSSCYTFSIFSFTFSIMHYRKSAGALHHGCESIGHVGPGVLDDAAASLSKRCSEARHPKKTHLPQPEFPVSSTQAGWTADAQTEAVPSSLTSLSFPAPPWYKPFVTSRLLSLSLSSTLTRVESICK